MESKPKTAFIQLVTTGYLLVCAVTTSAQDQTISIDKDFITWKTESVENTISGDKSNTNDLFKSSPDSITWIGKSVAIMHIDSKHDTWGDITTDGAVSFNVIWNNIPGTIWFRKSNGETTVVTEFVKDNVNVAPYRYVVSQAIKD